MHAIELLLDDHEMVAGLFDRVRANRGTADTLLFENIKAALRAHKHIEETLFYPKLSDEGDEELKRIVNTSIEDHRQVKAYLDELSQLKEGDDKFASKLKVVMEDVERHAEEEEGRMFPLVEDQFAEEVLETLGTQMAAEKVRFESAYHNGVSL